MLLFADSRHNGSSPALHQYLRPPPPTTRSWWRCALTGDRCNLVKRWRLGCRGLPGHRYDLKQGVAPFKGATLCTETFQRFSLTSRYCAVAAIHDLVAFLHLLAIGVVSAAGPGRLQRPFRCHSSIPTSSCAPRM